MFLKHCEGINQHSDTALFKVKARGIFITLTDHEGFCCCETRFCVANEPSFKLNGIQSFSAKIKLDDKDPNSLIYILKQSARKHNCKLKSNVFLFANEQKILKAKEFSAIEVKDTTAEIILTGVEHRIRDYFILSENSFEKNSQVFASFTINNKELGDLITTMCTLSGISGGIGTLNIELLQKKIEQNSGSDKIGQKSKYEEKEACCIKFAVQSNGGCAGYISIICTNESEGAKMIKFPEHSFDISYIMTYLKRCQGLVSKPEENSTFLVSNNGVMIKTEMHDNVRSLVCISAIKDVPLLQDSFS